MSRVIDHLPAKINFFLLKLKQKSKRKSLCLDSFSLYTSEGLQVTDGEKLESGQLYVAVGRERFKKLPYSDLLFSKPRGTRIIRG